MNRLDPASSSAFLERFCNFYDGVVRSVRLDFHEPSQDCELLIDTQDSESPSGWSKVSFLVKQVGAFRFEIGRTSFVVLSSGIQLDFSRGRVLVILDAYPDDPGLPDLSTNEAYVSGESCDWSVTPIIKKAIGAEQS